MKQLMGAVLLAATAACGPAKFATNSGGDGEGVDKVIDWAIGSGHRAARPRSVDSYLLLLPLGRPVDDGKRVTGACAPMTSFLPAPASDPRIFFSVGGRLHVQHKDGSRTGRPAPLERADPSLQVGRLLAFSSASSPLRLLATARPKGAAADDLWLFRVDETSILDALPASDVPRLGNEQDFFRNFDVPRCLSGGTRCLVVNEEHEECHLDVEPRRGQRRQPLQDLGNVTVRDAAWGASDGRSVYLLMACKDTTEP